MHVLFRLRDTESIFLYTVSSFEVNKHTHTHTHTHTHLFQSLNILFATIHLIHQDVLLGHCILCMQRQKANCHYIRYISYEMGLFRCKSKFNWPTFKKSNCIDMYRSKGETRCDNCPPTLVGGDYSNGFVRPSIRPPVHPFVDTSLSPQHLLQFSRDFDETFQLLFP